MTTNRPITVSFPLGLFCAATMSVPQQDPPKASPVPTPTDRKVSQDFALDLGIDELDDETVR